ncbi:hypothetical protein [Paraburkholderia sp. C35]|uniref:hypothetical protein n=1 Tax=Paraburkholderia sp. C35 TaxID=2126993 RepID=UPI000D68C5C5|nr:hypothetical protein [Paraburkholderia sp. C35]
MNNATGYETENDVRPAAVDNGALVDACALLGVTLTRELRGVLGMPIEALAGAFDGAVLLAGREAWL